MPDYIVQHRLAQSINNILSSYYSLETRKGLILCYKTVNNEYNNGETIHNNGETMYCFSIIVFIIHSLIA